MLDIEKTLSDHGILDVIRTLSSNGESGKLQIQTGTTSGALFFSKGLLVDARIGSLTGFRAINAAASLPDASLSFDPSIAPPPFSSITPSERVVLKQFFGIDAVAPEVEPEYLMPDEDPQYLIPEEEPEYLIPEEPEEVTLVTSNAPTAVTSNAPSAELPTPLPYIPPPTTSLRGSGLAVAAVVFLLATAAVILLYKFGDLSSPTSVASVTTSSQPSSPAVAEPAKPQVTSTDHGVSAPPVDHSAAPAPIDRVASAKPIDRVAPAPAIDRGASAAQDLTGKWNIVNVVQKTSYNSYNNLKIGFDLSIQQNGKGFTGRGVKVSENGRSLPAGSRTPIQVEGSIDGDRVEATFYEQGTARKTNGRFVWRIDKTGGLSGTFNTTAARSSGKSTARKV